MSGGGIDLRCGGPPGGGLFIFSLAFEIFHRLFESEYVGASQFVLIEAVLLSHLLGLLLLRSGAVSFDPEQADDHDARGAECVDGFEEGRSVERGDDFKDAAVAK